VIDKNIAIKESIVSCIAMYCHYLMATGQSSVLTHADPSSSIEGRIGTVSV